MNKITDQRKVLKLAEESGLINLTQEFPHLKGSTAFPFHRKQLYAFAELILEHREDITYVSNEPMQG